jgi:hypothetical protein
MLWFLRLAGAFGMVLSLTLFVWVFADSGDYFGGAFHSKGRVEIKELRDGLKKFIQDLHVPCLWFGWSGMLYILAHTAMRKKPFPPAQAGGYAVRFGGQADCPSGITRL